MDVQPLHVQPLAGLDPADELGGAGGEAELGSCVARQDVGMGVGHDTGYDSDQNGLLAAVGDRGLEPIDIVGTVDDDEPDTVVHDHPGSLRRSWRCRAARAEQGLHLP